MNRKFFFSAQICVPAPVAFSASKASSFFKGFLLLSFGLTILCVGLFVGLVSPSTACGPFRNVTIDGDSEKIVYNYVIEGIYGREDWLETVGSKLVFLVELAQAKRTSLAKS